MENPKREKSRRYVVALLRHAKRDRMAWRESELAAAEVAGVIELPLAVALSMVKRWELEDAK